VAITHALQFDATPVILRCNRDARAKVLSLYSLNLSVAVL